MKFFKGSFTIIILAALFMGCSYREPLVVTSATKYSENSLTEYGFAIQFPSPALDICSKKFFMPGDSLELVKKGSYILKKDLKNVPDSILLSLAAHIPDSVLQPYRIGKKSFISIKELFK